MDNLLQLHKSIAHNQSTAKNNNLNAKQVQQLQYNIRSGSNVFHVGDWVMVKHHQRVYQVDPLRIGPFKIIKALPNDNYLIHNHLRGLYLSYNVVNLSPYVKPAEAAVYDPQDPHEPKHLDSYKSKPASTPAPNQVLPHQVLPNVTPPVSYPIPISSTVNAGNLSSMVKSPAKNIDVSPSKDPIVGKRISVYWDKYKKWYPGTVVAKSDDGGGTHDVDYDDDKEKGLDPISEKLTGSDIVKWKEINT